MTVPAVLASRQAALFDAWSGSALGNATKQMVMPYTTGAAGGGSPVRDAAGSLVPDRLQFVTDDPPPGQPRSLRLECRQHDTELYYSSLVYKERVQLQTWAAPVFYLLPRDEVWMAVWFKVDSGFVAPRPATDITGITGAASTDTFTKTAHGLVNGEYWELSAKTGGTGLTVGLNYFVINATANTFQLSTSIETPVAVNFTTDVTAATLHTDAQFCILWQTFDSDASTHKISVCLNYHMDDAAGANSGWQLEYQQAGVTTFAYPGEPVALDTWYAFLIHALFDDGSNGDGVSEIFVRKAGEKFPTTPQARGTGANIAAGSNATNTIYPTVCNYRATKPQTDIVHCGGVRIASSRAQAESLFPV